MSTVKAVEVVDGPAPEEARSCRPRGRYKLTREERAEWELETLARGIFEAQRRGWAVNVSLLLESKARPRLERLRYDLADERRHFPRAQNELVDVSRNVVDVLEAVLAPRADSVPAQESADRD